MADQETKKEKLIRILKRKKYFLLTVLVLLGFIYIGNVRDQKIRNQFIGKSIPNFSLQVEQQLQAMNIENVAGKKILLVFFATWCGICQVESPFINRLYRRLSASGKEDWLVLAISEENPEIIKTFVTEKDLNYPVIFDDESKLHDFFGIRSYPTKVRIDEQGLIADIANGFNPFSTYLLYEWITGEYF